MRLRVPAPRETIMIWEYGGAGGGEGREREREIREWREDISRRQIVKVRMTGRKIWKIKI